MQQIGTKEIKELRRAIFESDGMTDRKFARATGWLEDGVCKTPYAVIERYVDLNPNMRPDEAVQQMKEALQ